MQTFLISGNFEDTARVLDNKRLGKQRVECLQILKALTKLEKNPGAKIGWKNHPAVRMWKDYDQALVQYGVAICLEWAARGFQDSCCAKIMEFRREGEFFSYPDFLNDEKLILSHKSNLIRKKPEHYRKFWPEVPDNIPYFWPV